jgi:hypothetical protein
MLRRLFLAASIVVAAACGDEPANPFSTSTRPPSAQAVILFVSGSIAYRSSPRRRTRRRRASRKQFARG